MEQDHIGRMLAEMRYTKLGSAQVGDFLHIASNMYHAKGKAFYTAHILYTHRGTPVAIFELCTLAVDMKARRAINLPDFVFARLSEN
jgi:acyl-CoA thioesterase FadM